MRGGTAGGDLGVWSLRDIPLSISESDGREGGREEGKSDDCHMYSVNTLHLHANGWGEVWAQVGVVTHGTAPL